MKPEIIIAPAGEMARRVVIDLQREAAAAPSHRPFTLAIPGGSVARMCLPALANADVDWKRVELFFVDERAVPPDSPESNFALARALWLDRARARPARVHRMRAEAVPLADAAKGYAAEVYAAAGDPPRLDYVLLGVGPDGHVASLFTGDTTFDTTGDGTVGWTTGSPKPPAVRMTLTATTLADAARVVVAALGQDKAAAVEAGIRGDADTPLAALLHATRRPLVLVDAAAAGRVELP